MRDGEEKPRTIAVLPRLIVSYNVERSKSSESCMVYQFVFGRKVAKKLASRKKTYRYPGLIDRPEVEPLGQSVLMMMEKDADEFTSFLWKLRVPYTVRRVWVEA